MRSWCRVSGLLLLGAAACTFNTRGRGTSEAGTGGGTGGQTDGPPADTGGTGEDTSGGDDTDTATTPSPDDTSGGGDTDVPEPPDGDTGPTGGECNQTIELRLSLEDAEVTYPMEVVDSRSEGSAARSLHAGEGTVEFSFALECTDQMFFWGRVFDFNPGTQQNDPDSYFMSVDDGTEIEWFYGCETGDTEGWGWHPVKQGMAGGSCEEATLFSRRLTAGEHTIRIRNREGVNQNDEFAAIAGMTVTNDSSYVPSRNDRPRSH